MLFSPQKYLIGDEKFTPFIDPEEIRRLLAAAVEPGIGRVREILARSLNLERLSMGDVAVLLQVRDAQALDEISRAASELKRKVYGERIVVFAPLYVGNRCINNCAYCGFRSSNRDAVRHTLTDGELTGEVLELERTGQKRLVLVYGEHPAYDADYIAHTVRLTYSLGGEQGRINRVNINAAPFDVDGFRTIKEAGIGTYQIFQETYDPAAYGLYHPSGRKADYEWRLTSMDRAIEAGIDDVGLGVLFGLADWRFEVMALVRHTNHLEAVFGMGPHTISMPRIQRASNLDREALNLVSDEDFARIVSVLRLAVPYAGLILTAREPRSLRDRLIGLGISQIDAGTKLEIGGYSRRDRGQDINREQFELTDTRSLEQVAAELVSTGQIPSFCTACYRKGRTGEHFMEFSTKGFIKNFCTPNALLTFAEYLHDYAGPQLQRDGWALIGEKTAQMDTPMREKVTPMLERIKSGEKDLLL